MQARRRVRVGGALTVLSGRGGSARLRRTEGSDPRSPRESGGIGRRAGFRILWAKHPWGFKSPLSHHHKFVTLLRILNVAVSAL
jgi:hypothetical protein